MNLTNLKNNFYNLTFFIVFELYVLYLYLTNNFITYQYNILLSCTIYEFLNCFIEYCNNYQDKQFILYMCHHICSFISGLIILLYYDKIKIINDLILFGTYTILPGLFLNLQYVFDKSIIIKLIFLLTFIYFRIILCFPFIIKAINYILLSNDFIEQLLCYFAIGFYLLSCYWIILIIRKALKYI